MPTGDQMRVRTQAPAMKPGTTQVVNFDASVPSAAAVQAEVVRVVATQDCHLAFGLAPVATINDLLLPANTPEYFLLDAGHKIAAIKDSTLGKLFITAEASS